MNEIKTLLNRLSPAIRWPLHTYPKSIIGAGGSALSLLMVSLHERMPLLCVMEGMEEASYLYSDLKEVLGEEAVVFFPSSYRRAIKYGHRDEANELLRSMTLGSILSRRSAEEAMPIVVTYPEALAESVPLSLSEREDLLTLIQGQVVEREQIVDKLIEWGFSREDYVYTPGQFALRGSILDIYAYASEYPYRIDFFDNEIESLRLFEVESQLSVETCPSITLMPNLSQNQGEAGGLWQLLPPETLVIHPNEHYLLDRISYIWQDEPTVHDTEGFVDMEAVRSVLVSPEEATRQLADMHQCYYMTSSLAQEADSESLVSAATPLSLLPRDYPSLSAQILQMQREGLELWLSAPNPEQYERTLEILMSHAPSLIPPVYLPAVLHEGFVDATAGIALLTEHQIFGRYHKYSLRSDKARSGRITHSLKELSSFQQGDIVVHADHGIGRFIGLTTLNNGGQKQEAVRIEYEAGAYLFVSLHNLHKLSHYRSRDEADAVTLSKLGGGRWNSLKEKAKKHVKDVARELIALYAQRKQIEGFAFSPDSYLQHELEASFMYEDTPDQRRITEEIKADMEKPYPMDRLLCGDVGFGKTELAIRAAFKAVTDGKQVAVLAPTTILVYQHYRTFSSRLKEMPVRIGYLSRTRSAKENKETLQALKTGELDIIIGTHKLTGKDVIFKDLGLLIIDEEQKFGVSAKERLRQMQVNVDTLTMSATPIPRTLQFSLMGARDLSNLQTPPPNRYPIDTILTRFSADTLREAIEFELSRNGQVYMLHNRIDNIEEVANIIRREVPDARVGVGHGRMSSGALEDLLMAFGRHEIDVLVSTTIIESGIDVSNANTMIINDAHRFGLSSLHQLRGRVGRSGRKAFCYLLTPPMLQLPVSSQRRLRAIESFSDLGSGARIAMQDLDIRGAGNALGKEQSGFEMNMGYEAYQMVFEEAVQELRAEEFSHVYQPAKDAGRNAGHFVAETSVDTDLPVCLPESYVPTDAERILLYRELDVLRTEAELEAYRSRLKDRFGTLPPEAEELIRVPALRRLGRKLGIVKINLRAGKLSLSLLPNIQSPYYQSDVFGSLLHYVSMHQEQCKMDMVGERRMVHISSVPSVKEALEVCARILNSPTGAEYN